MQAIEVESKNEDSLYVGIIFSPSFAYWNVDAFHGFMNAEKPIKWKIHTLKTHGIAAARNNIVKSFLNLDYSHILMMDSDVILEEDTISQMLQQNEDVVVANLPQKGTGGVATILHSELPYHRDMSLLFKENEIIKDYFLAAFGCVLIKRSVFEKMEFPYFRYASQEFEEVSDYERVSEDFYFFIKLRDLKIKPVFVSSAIPKHIQTAAWGRKGLEAI